MNLSLQAEKIHLGGFHQAGLDGEEKVMMRWGCCRNDRGGGNGVELAALFRMTLFWSYPGITLLINGKKRAFVCDTGACRTTAENRSQTDLYSWIQEEWVQLMLKEEMGLRTQMATIGNDPFKICRKSSKWMRTWWNSDAKISTPSWLDNKMMEKRHQREDQKDGLLWCRERGTSTIITLWTPPNKLPPGYCESPTISSQVLMTSRFQPPGGSQILLYADDVVLSSPDEETC